MSDNPYAQYKRQSANPYAKYARPALTEAEADFAADPRPDWVKRQDEAVLQIMGGIKDVHDPSKYGEFLLPGQSVSKGIFGKEMVFENPDSPLPTGFKEGNTIFQSLREGKYGEAALDTLGAVGDVATIGAATPIVRGVAKGMGKVGKLATSGAEEGAAYARALSNLPPVAAAPTSAVLKDAAKAAYKEAEDYGASVNPGVFKMFVENTKEGLRKKGYDPELHQIAKPAVRRLDEAAASDKAMTIEELEILRRVASEARLAAPDDATYAKASQIVGSIDEFFDAIKADDLVAGDLKAFKALKRARPLYHKAKKIEDIEEIIDIAKRQDDPNAFIKRQFTRITTDNDRMKRYTKSEQKLVEKIAKDGLLDDIGKLTAPSKSPLGMVKGVVGPAIGFGIAGPVGSVAVPAVGIGSKMAGAAIRRGRVKELEELIGRGAPPPTILERMRAARAAERMRGRDFLLAPTERDVLLKPPR